MKLSTILSLPECGVSQDTETYWLTELTPVPKLVLGSVAVADPEVLRMLDAYELARLVGNEQAIAELGSVLEGREPLPGKLLTKKEICQEFIDALASDTAVVIGANLSFDICVIAKELARSGYDVWPLVFKALEEGRVFDLQMAEALHAIAEGHLGKDPRTGRDLVNPETGRKGMYSLSMCVSLNLGRTDAKENDEYRERYGEFDDLPLSELPPEAQQYPVDDVQNALECALAQTGHVKKTTPHHAWQEDGSCADCGAVTFGEQCLVKRRHRNLCNLREQVYAAVCLQLGAVWGFRVDQSKVDTIERYAIAKREKTIGPFKEAGLIRPDGTENRSLLKKKIAVAYGSSGPCTTCHGTGKVLAPNPRTLVCKACKGKCVPWKKKGMLVPPTVASCDNCSSTGRVVDVKHVVNCIGPEDEEGTPEKTCDGTGLLLDQAVPRSEKDGISYGADALHESGDDFLMSYGDFGEDGKWLKDYVPYLRLARVPVAGHHEECPTLHFKKGTRRPHCTCEGPWRDVPLFLRPDPIKETGRVAYKGYIQLFPRWAGFFDEESKTYIPSFRECIVPPGAQYEEYEVGDDYVLQDGEEWS